MPAVPTAWHSLTLANFSTINPHEHPIKLAHSRPGSTQTIFPIGAGAVNPMDLDLSTWNTFSLCILTLLLILLCLYIHIYYTRKPSQTAKLSACDLEAAYRFPSIGLRGRRRMARASEVLAKAEQDAESQDTQAEFKMERQSWTRRASCGPWR
ncbi:hypothetical protein BU26DRAFT_569978 [Trematosphaeria pertusa]|uniref:Uncharacterized protein n=1 Tax=Trematosphaeria pertusa TaxID=390896 RepID=A0A6A6HZ15_9PLEO|nr:uncharacterized protein BU26DRAFT_569978 [Trematosphaeria pertusa]KAF2243277.1 hypothetical protein BU26DRAFT_569978 [Trematosphaeria pertusa]